MSLRVWLPLTKDLRNQGLDEVTVINNGATFNSAGKLGGCYSFGTGNSYITVDSTPLKTFTEFSFACWIKIISWNTSYSTIFAAKDSTNVSWNNLIFSLLRNSTNSTLCFNIANGSSYTSTSCQTGALSLNTWYHITCTYKNGQIKLYQDGNVVSTYNTSVVPNFNSIVNLWIGKSNENSYQSNNLLNDVRIYDHCLSPMEVKELAKGLVLHYPLNGSGLLASLGYQRLEYLQSTGTQRIDTGIIPQNTYTYKFKYSMDTISGYVGPFGAYNAESVNTTRIIAYNGSLTNLLIFFDSKAGGGGVTINSITNAAGQIIEGYLSKTSYLLNNLNTDTIISNSSSTDLFTNKGTTLTDNMMLFGYGSLYMSGKIYYFDTCVNNNFIQRLIPVKRISDNTLGMFDLISQTFFTNIGSGTFTAGPVVTESTIEYDCSGFCNNGTRTGTFTWTSDTPKYQVSQNFTSPGTIYVNDFSPNSTDFKNSYTIATWIKTTTTNGMICGGLNSYYDIWIYSDSIYLNVGDGASTSNAFLNNGTKVPISIVNNGQWHHIAVTGNGSTAILYIDGVERGRAGTYRNFQCTTLYINGWSTANEYHFNGNMSDFRIYATALFADDVLSLYQNSAYIDSGGNIYGTIHE